MSAETLIGVRGDLVRKVRVDELLLSIMMETPVITDRQKTDIQRVCTSTVFCDIGVCSELVKLVLSSVGFFLLFDRCSLTKIVENYNGFHSATRQ